MTRIIFIPFLLIIAFGCSKEHTNNKAMDDLFTSEIIELKDYFRIPGLAVLIKQGDRTIYENYLGTADVDKQTPMDSTITIPMASLTKIFSSILIWQLVDEGKISLEDRVRKYTDSPTFPDSVKIEHVLSHTSQGLLGQHFYYNNNRFMLLEKIIVSVSKQSFKSMIYQKIIEPLGLQNTYLLQDSTQVTNENRKIAQPYFLGGEMKDGYQEKDVVGGFIDYGYSAAAGISSTVRDLANFSKGLDKGHLISGESRDMMFTAYKPGLPYGLGIFVQEFMNEKLVWGYGQYDCYSSLLLMIPERDLVLILAANNNLMSDPARLIAGDVTYSLFALSFLKNFVFNLEEEPLFEDRNSLTTSSDKVTYDVREFYLKKLIAQSVAASFMGRFDENENIQSKIILRKVFEIFPDYASYGDLVLMHNLHILKFMNSLRGKGDFPDFDIQLIGIGKSLLAIDEFNPYANYYMANYYQGKGITDSTSFYYGKIIGAKNFSPWWYTKEAQNWIDENMPCWRL